MKKICMILMVIGALHAEELMILNLKPYTYAQGFALEMGYLSRHFNSSFEVSQYGSKLRIGTGRYRGAIGAVWGSRVALSYLNMRESNNAFTQAHNYIGVEALGMVMFGIGFVELLFDTGTGDMKMNFGIGIGI